MFTESYGRQTLEKIIARLKECPLFPLAEDDRTEKDPANGDAESEQKGHVCFGRVVREWLALHAHTAVDQCLLTGSHAHLK